MIKIAILSWIAFAISVLIIRVMASASKEAWLWKLTDNYPIRVIVMCWVMAILFIVSVATSVITIITW